MRKTQALMPKVHVLRKNVQDKNMVSRTNNLKFKSLKRYATDGKKVLPLSVSSYIEYSAGDGEVMKSNETSFSRYNFRPRVLRDVSNVDLSTSLLGDEINFPVCISPTACHGLVHQDGEVATAKAASEMKTIYTMSFFSSHSIEEVATNTPCSLKWMQIHLLKDPRKTEDIIQRAEENGFKAIVVTVDSPIYPYAYDIDEENDFGHVKLGNLTKYFEEEYQTMDYWELTSHVVSSSTTWEYIRSIRKYSSLPIVLKGILTGDMAKEAVTEGVDGIWVSNHGGRLLEGLPATIDVLEEVVNAVGDKCEVYMDGGIRSGSDVIKALALGAQAVFIGRPVLWGLACQGKEGVCGVLSTLKNEVKETMQLIGFQSIEELQSNRSVVKM